MANHFWRTKGADQGERLVFDRPIAHGIMDMTTRIREAVGFHCLSR
ncbi:MAG: hypothetical protein AB9828_02985 [Sphaerochaetaceae bacterium]